MNKKTVQLARKSALSLKVSAEAITITENFTFDAPKTAQVADMLSAFNAEGKKALILTTETDHNVYKSARNIPGVEVMEAYKPNTYQILNADVILIQEGAVSILEDSILPKSEEAAA